MSGRRSTPSCRWPGRARRSSATGRTTTHLPAATQRRRLQNFWSDLDGAYGSTLVHVQVPFDDELAQSVMQTAGPVLLVVKSGLTQQQDLAYAIEQLTWLGVVDHVVGVVSVSGAARSTAAAPPMTARQKAKAEQAAAAAAAGEGRCEGRSAVRGRTDGTDVADEDAALTPRGSRPWRRLSLAPAAAPALTVVVPTRGRPELVRAAVQGVVAQRYDGPIHCIVVHDQEAPDHTLEELAGPGRTVRGRREPGRGRALGLAQRGARPGRPPTSSRRATTTTRGCRTRSPSRWPGWRRTPPCGSSAPGSGC